VVRPSAIALLPAAPFIASVDGMLALMFSWLQAQLKRKGVAPECMGALFRSVTGRCWVWLERDLDIMEFFEGRLGKSCD
jgi:hypothetical protein